MIFKKTLLLIVLVFCATYVWFNFDLIYFEIETRLGIASEETILEEVELVGQTFLYPVASAKENNESKPTVTSSVPSVVPLASKFILSVPALQLEAPIVFEPTTVESRIYSALEKGVVHYAETPMPGQFGTMIILGHSSSYPWYKGSYGSIFSKLSDLKSGDVINIEKEGQLYSYRVSKSLIFSPQSADDFQLRELESTDGSSLVLMTCWPTGANSKRIAVRADLVI